MPTLAFMPSRQTTRATFISAAQFTFIGTTHANYIAKWDGSSWSNLGSGIGSYNTFYYPPVRALAMSGTNLYAGGNFTNAGGVTASYIAKWDGSNGLPWVRG